MIWSWSYRSLEMRNYSCCGFTEAEWDPNQVRSVATDKLTKYSDALTFSWPRIEPFARVFFASNACHFVQIVLSQCAFSGSSVNSDVASLPRGQLRALLLLHTTPPDPLQYSMGTTAKFTHAILAKGSTEPDIDITDALFRIYIRQGILLWSGSRQPVLPSIHARSSQLNCWH